MMARLIARGEALARKGQSDVLREIAAQVKTVLGSAAIDVDEARILVTGRAIVARWFTEPRLRFLGRGLK